MCLLIMVFRVPDVGAASPSNLQVLPNELGVGESFQGAEIKVSAEVPAGSNVVVEFRGDAHEDRLLRKGRRGGLWMNVGEVTVYQRPVALSSYEHRPCAGFQSRFGKPMGLPGVAEADEILGSHTQSRER